MKRERARGERATYCGRTRTGKIRYRSLKDAKVARHFALRKRPGYLRVYKCPTCSGYHLTSAELRGEPSTVWREPAA